MASYRACFSEGLSKVTAGQLIPRRECRGRQVKSMPSPSPPCPTMLGFYMEVAELP